MVLPSSEDEDDFDDYVENGLSEDCVFSSNYKEVLLNTRKIIKIFKKGPTKNSVLQKYVVAEMNKEMSLYLDVVTRWNSMVPMIEKFLL